MVQSRSSSRFLHETTPAIRVRGFLRRQHLDRDITAKPRVLGLVHFTHPTGTDKRHDLVMTEGTADKIFLPSVSCHQSPPSRGPRLSWSKAENIATVQRELSGVNNCGKRN